MVTQTFDKAITHKKTAFRRSCLIVNFLDYAFLLNHQQSLCFYI